MSPTGELHPWLNTKANEAWAEISPDGKTMAYGSDASGQFEVYAQPFPGPGSRQQVSIDGGNSPLWSHRGKELFFFHPVVTKEARLEELCVVDFTSESLLAVGKPRALFSGQYGRLGSLTNYDISLDDQRFLMTEHLTVPDASVARLHVVLNWSEELRRLSSPGAKR
jgi:serine/threonine-protein kinase